MEIRSSHVAAAVALASAALAGCLLPSFDGFDGMEGPDQSGSAQTTKTGNAPAAGGSAAASTATTQAAATTTGASAAAPTGDGGGGSSTFACGSSQCTAGESVCCKSLLGDQKCVSSAGDTLGCAEVRGCGSNADCPGAVCCIVGPQTSCQSSCIIGTIACNPNAPQCPASAPHCVSFFGDFGCAP